MSPTDYSQYKRITKSGETPIARRERRTQELQRNRLMKHLFHWSNVYILFFDKLHWYQSNEVDEKIPSSDDVGCNLLSIINEHVLDVQIYFAFLDYQNFINMLERIRLKETWQNIS